MSKPGRNAGGKTSGADQSWYAAVEDPHAELRAYKSALEESVIVGVTDRAGRITYVNQRFCEISKYDQAELIGGTHAMVNSGYHPRAFFKEMWRTIGSGSRWRGEICNRAKDGGLYWVDTTIVPQVGASGRIDGYVSLRLDITQKKYAEAALQAEIDHRREAETVLREVLETVPDAIAAFDDEDRLLYFNSSYREFYPCTASIIEKGRAFEDILRAGVEKGQFVLPADDPQSREEFIEARMKRHRSPGKPYNQHLTDGRWLQVNERLSATGHVVGVRTDITAIKQAEQRIRMQAQRDPLTGLYNRSVLFSKLTRQIENTRRAGTGGALVVLDLDRFKEVNDTLGHDAGDQLLVEVGRRIEASVRASDTVVRLGGDEFAIILPRLVERAAIERLLNRLMAAIVEPVSLDVGLIRPAASLGVSVYPEDAPTARELLKNADIALYNAKAQGRAGYSFFTAGLRREVERRKQVAEDLQQALELGEIDVALQPQFSIRSGAHSGFEALARWRHAGRDVPPGDFIPIAEETGLIVPLGKHVLDRALAEFARLRRLGLNPGMVAVNVAAAQLKLESYPETVLQQLKAHDVSPQQLEIEVTETVLLDRSAHRIAVSLAHLHGAGVSIALDDFGTGHASLAHLKSFPVDRLKIDRSFVAGIGREAEDEIIVRTILNLAHNLGKRVVAEGIETEEQLDFLKVQGCDVGQGFLVSRPLAPPQAVTFLAHGEAAVRAAVSPEGDEEMAAMPQAYAMAK